MTCAHTAGPAVSEMHRLGARPTAHAYTEHVYSQYTEHAYSQYTEHASLTFPVPDTKERLVTNVAIFPYFSPVPWLPVTRTCMLTYGVTYLLYTVEPRP